MLSSSFHQSYRVVRYYRDRPAHARTRIFRQDLTWDEAQAIVNSTEGSSDTAVEQHSRWHNRYGSWFLGITKQ